MAQIASSDLSCQSSLRSVFLRVQRIMHATLCLCVMSVSEYLKYESSWSWQQQQLQKGTLLADFFWLSPLPDWGIELRSIFDIF